MKPRPDGRRSLSATLLLTLPAPAGAQPHLGTGELRIAGVQLVVSPATQTVPRNQATGLTVTLEDPAYPGQPLTALPAALLGRFVVKGELSGPGFAAPEELSVAFGSSPTALLPIPPLLAAGNYVVDNLRLEQCTGGGACATSQFLLPGEPAVAAIDVIERGDRDLGVVAAAVAGADSGPRPRHRRVEPTLGRFASPGRMDTGAIFGSRRACFDLGALPLYAREATA